MENIWKIVKKKPYIPLFFILFIISIVYIPALNIYLIGDDFEWLNLSYSGWYNPLTLLKLINNFFRPLIKFSYLLNYTLFKTQVPFYAMTTILIHLLNIVLLYIFLYKITRRVSITAITTLIFGTSPMYSEVTLWAAARPDLILLPFILGNLIIFANFEGKLNWRQNMCSILLAICAAGSKETWVLLPFFVLCLLLIIKKIRFTVVLRSTLILFILVFIYIAIFIIVPFLSDTTPPTSYGKVNIGENLIKFGYLIFKYAGLSRYYSGEVWQLMIIALFAGGIGYLLIKKNNRLALFGICWMVLTIIPSLPIYYAPSRYNYLPLIGFWIMVVAFIDQVLKTGFQKVKIRKYFFPLFIMISLFYIVIYNVIILEWEIRDYRKLGGYHKTVVNMYKRIRNQIPLNQTVIFVNEGVSKPIEEVTKSLHGYRKLLFSRDKAVWSMLYLAPLANFMGNPFKVRMELIPEKDLAEVFQRDYIVLVFRDNGFFFSQKYKDAVKRYYFLYSKLPERFQALRFRRVVKI